MATRIMVVDDEPAIGKLLLYQLSGFGYQVSYIQDGLSALQRLTAERPDLVLLDVMMPHISGWEICRQNSGLLERAGDYADGEERRPRHRHRPPSRRRRLYHQAIQHGPAPCADRSGAPPRGTGFAKPPCGAAGLARRHDAEHPDASAAQRVAGHRSRRHTSRGHRRRGRSGSASTSTRRA